LVLRREEEVEETEEGKPREGPDSGRRPRWPLTSVSSSMKTKGVNVILSKNV
jgi:hypothetical protein